VNILVTGGAGFIGSHLVDAFLTEGHRVIVVDNLSTGRKENLNPQAVFYLMDIRSEELSGIFEKEGIEAVCHQAAQMDVRKSVHDPLFDADVNIKGTLNILQNCIKWKAKKVLFASTGGAIYGEQESFPCDESHPTKPLSPYGVAKRTVELYLNFYAQQYGLNYTILRYANVYGPRQNPRGEAGVVAIFSSRLLAGEETVINGDGKQTRDYVYVGDVVRANKLALEKSGNDIYNVGTSRETDVNRLFELINKETGSRAREKHGPAMPGEQRRSVIDYGKIKRELGWRPQVSLEEGIRNTVAYFRNGEK